MFLLESASNFIDCTVKKLAPRIHCRYFGDGSLSKFIVSGIITGGVVDLFFLFIFHGIFHFSIEISTTTAFTLAFVVGFYLQKFWTFENKEKHLPKQFTLYLMSTLFAINLNVILMKWFTHSLHIWYLLAQIITNLIIGCYNFVSNKFIVFRREDHETNC